MKKLLPTLAFSLVIVLIAFAAREIFTIKNVTITNGNCISLDELPVKGKFILTTTLQEIRSLVEKFPCAYGSKVQKVLPNSVEIIIPKESVILKIAQTSLALTSNHNIVDSPDSGLPVLYLPQGLELYQQSNQDARIVFVVRLVELLVKTDFYPATIRIIREQEVVVYDQKQKIAVFTAEKNASSQVDSLQQTLAAAKIDGDKIAKIDLRYGKPVVTFK